MDGIFRKTFFVVVTAFLSGCSSNVATNSIASTRNAAAENAKEFVMHSGGTAVLKLTATADTKCAAGDGTLHLNGPVLFDKVEIWLARGATTVDEAAEKVDSKIVSEFKDFKPDRSSVLTIAGSPAKRLVGPGHEADDGDAGAADVIIFKVGGHVFVACTHGESLEPLAQQWLLALVQTAQKP